MPSLLSLFLIFLLVSLAHCSELTQKVDAVMNQFVDRAEISGAVTMAIHQGEIIHISAVGMANPDSKEPMSKNALFRIVSLTKNYSAVLVKILEEQGKLSVHDKVSKHLPESPRRYSIP